MDSKALISKYKAFIVNIIVIIVAFNFAYGVHKKQVKNLNLLKEKKETEIKKNEVLKDIKKQAETFKSYKESVNNKDITTTIDRLGSIAAASSVKIVSIRPMPEENYPLYVKYSFELKIEGADYHALGKYIARLESSPDIYTVESAVVTPEARQSEAGQEVKMVVNLRISTVYLKN